MCLHIEKPNPMCVFSELLCSIIPGKYAHGNTLNVNGDWRLINKYFMLCQFDNYFVSDFIYTRRKLMINYGFVLLFCSCLEFGMYLINSFTLAMLFLENDYS